MHVCLPVKRIFPAVRPDSHRSLTLTLKLLLTLKYCLLHFNQSIHTVWARSTLTLKLTIKSKDIMRGAMSLSVSVSGRCESHFLLSRAQIIAEGACFLLILCTMNKIYRNYRCRWSQQCSLLLCTYMHKQEQKQIG